MKRWNKVNEVLQQALALTGDPREEFLLTACAEDLKLEQSVRSLLAADASAGQFLEQPLFRQGGERTRPEPPLMRRIGPYRLLRRIGQGGMSTVYLAQRDDAFERQVALKLIRQDMESDETERRLRSERKILALLDHLYIARLFDGGTTDDGLPYFVMEHVEGLPIDEYCDQQQLSVGERLVLFQKILEAVHYAHQNLIVHRDLKPSNILVTADGHPKLLDFGIAKILNAKLAAAEDGEATATWMRVLTPSYASPEQVRGTAITTASDVYSLGILLFKLLTGALPYRFAGRTPQEIERSLAAAEAPRPSAVVSVASATALEAEKGDLESTTAPAVIARARRTTPKQLREELRGDLDAIIGKALEPAPQRRFGSVEQFSQDLQRHLTGFPVRASPGSASYRLGKFLRRHRKAAAGGALLAILAALLVGMLALQNVRISRERDRVLQQRDVTAQVLNFTERIFGLADPAVARGVEWTVAEALDHSEELIEKELADEPEIRSRLHSTVGRVLRGLGDGDAAVSHLDKAYHLERQVSGAVSVEAAQAQSDLASAWLVAGDFTRAKELAFEAVELYRQLTGLQDPGSAVAFNTYVSGLCAEGDFATAEAAAGEALELARRLLGNHDPETARAMHNRAHVLNQSGDHAAARALYQEALDVRRAALGEPHPDIASSLRNLAATLFQQQEYPQAERTYHLALAQQRLLLGEEHPDLAPTLNNIAVLHQKLGQWAQAEAAYRQALALFPEDHVQRLRLDAELASLLNKTGQSAAAEELLRQALAYWRPKLNPGNTLVAWAESALGEALIDKTLPDKTLPDKTSMSGTPIDRSRLEEAEVLLVRSLPLIRERRGLRDQYTQKALRRLVRLYEVQDRPEEAAKFRAQLIKP